MDNIITLKEAGSHNDKSKYMHLRLYLSSLYKILEQEYNGGHGNITGTMS